MPSRSAAPAGTLLSEVKPERIRWLWPGRLAYGKLTVADGDPGQGKSLCTCDLAARLSTSRAMPDASQLVELRGVVWRASAWGAGRLIWVPESAWRAYLQRAAKRHGAPITPGAA